MLLLVQGAENAGFEKREGTGHGAANIRDGLAVLTAADNELLTRRFISGEVVKSHGIITQAGITIEPQATKPP